VLVVGARGLGGFAGMVAGSLRDEISRLRTQHEAEAGAAAVAR
jgi:hypothetical protein